MAAASGNHNSPLEDRRRLAHNPTVPIAAREFQRRQGVHSRELGFLAVVAEVENAEGTRIDWYVNDVLDGSVIWE
jgi:hypothetical protein